MKFNIKSKIKYLVNKAISPFGIVLVKSDRDFSFLAVLKNIEKRGYMPGSIIDIGASTGVWSKMAYNVFPDVHYLLFEPLDENYSAITELLKVHENWHFTNKIAGNQQGEARFNVLDDIDGSGVLSDDDEIREVRSYEMVTVDHEVERLNLPYPYLLKLDTHGFEIPILEGMSSIWDKIDFLIIEAYNFKLNSQSLKFYELISYLDAKGFSPIEIADLRRRPSDQLLWQMDIVFGKKDQKEFKNQRYSKI